MLTLTATQTAISPGLTSSFLASGGQPPYVYSLESNTASGSIDSGTGLYTAGTVLGRDVIQAKDSLGVTATLPIMIGCPLKLLCDIIQSEMDLDDGQVYLYNQKIDIPRDNNLYIAVGLVSTKPFGNSTTYDASGHSIQSTNSQATVSIDVMSRSTQALTRKEEILMALNSHYSIKQQEHNSFHIARIPTSFVNLSSIDGAAIPYRFQININMQYFVKKLSSIDYYDNGFEHQETVND